MLPPEARLRVVRTMVEEFLADNETAQNLLIRRSSFTRDQVISEDVTKDL